MREATNIHKEVANAVAKKFKANPQKPNNNKGRRPYLSDKADKIGVPKKLARLKEKTITPYQWVCSAGSAVNLPTNAGNTGTIKPTDSMSINTVIKMNGMAALRPVMPGPATSDVLMRWARFQLSRFFAAPGAVPYSAR
jgi:hypothetical protein